MTLKSAPFILLAIISFSLFIDLSKQRDKAITLFYVPTLSANQEGVSSCLSMRIHHSASTHPSLGNDQNKHGVFSLQPDVFLFQERNKSQQLRHP